MQLELLALKVSKDLLASLVNPVRLVLRVLVVPLAPLARLARTVTLENPDDLVREELLDHRVLVVSLELLGFLASRASGDTMVWMD